MDAHKNNLISNFYLSTPFKCSYLKDHQARSIVAIPLIKLNSAEYGNLLSQGFRRSGYYIYRPQCQNCCECIPVRIKVKDFLPTRSQKRTFRNFNHLKPQVKALEFNQEHFKLYKHYQQNRHPDSSMVNDSPEQYHQFFLESLVESSIIEFSENNKLKIISLIDYADDGLSAVYTFFDTTSQSDSGIGIFTVLWQIEYAKKLNLQYLYLGYYICSSKKMNYKANFQPLERYENYQWRDW